MRPYTPAIENPYPDSGWTRISDVVYVSDLYLYRAIAGVPFEGNYDFILWEAYTIRFKLDDEERTITVPSGMRTDFASVPRVAQSIVPRVGPYAEAAIVHDFLYIAWQILPGHGARDEDRKFADELFREAMKQAAVSGLEALLLYKAVRWFGGRAYWKEYAGVTYVKWD